jgi:hypothetical protein
MEAVQFRLRRIIRVTKAVPTQTRDTTVKVQSTSLIATLNVQTNSAIFNSNKACLPSFGWRPSQESKCQPEGSPSCSLILQ